MSNKQLAKAAVDGRRLRFSGPGVEVLGYLIGLDDYHYFVAARSSVDNEEAVTVLVHKSVPTITISRSNTLNGESALFREDVDALGAAFVRFCKTQILGQAPASVQA